MAMFCRPRGPFTYPLYVSDAPRHPRRHRLRRAAKWGATGADLAVLAGLWVTSVWWAVGVDFGLPNKRHVGLSSWRGGLCVSYGATIPWMPAAPPISFRLQSIAASRCRAVGFPHVPMVRQPRRAVPPQWSAAYHDKLAPTWLVLAGIIPATAILWLYDRRRFAPGRCQRCGYDLAGLAPNASCPECGQGAPA